MAYEEAHAAKESSFRIEAALNNFIKEQLDQIENPNVGSSNNKIKGFSKKQNFWYTVRCFKLNYIIYFIYFLIIYLFQLQFIRL
jgi:hypothetical protein